MPLMIPLIALGGVVLFYTSRFLWVKIGENVEKRIKEFKEEE